METTSQTIADGPHEPSRQEIAVVGQPKLPVEQVLGAIIAAASDERVDVSKMRELLGLQKELMAMQAEQQFIEAFQRLSGELPRITKSGAVEYKEKIAFKFATWPAIDAVIRPLLQREGFTLSFDSTPRTGDGGGLIVTGRLSHVGGHSRTASIPVPLDTSGGKNSIQGYGSAMSYGKRYTTTSLLNIITENEDDDGNRGGMKFITEAEESELFDLLKATNTEPSRFLDMMVSGIHELNEIESKDFVRLRNALLAKRQKLQQEKGA
jgi:hypothetical protein